MKNIMPYSHIIKAVIGIAILATIPFWVKSPYQLDLFIIMFVNAILAMCFLVVLRTGLICMSTVVYQGIGAYASTILVLNYGFSFWYTMPLVACAAGFCAWILGMFMLGKGAAIVQFILLNSILGMLFVVTIGNLKFLNGYYGIRDIPRPDAINLGFVTIDFSTKVDMFFLALFLFVIAALVLKAFYTAWTGRAWVALGLSQKLAESIGVSIYRYRMLAYILYGTLSGMAGSFYAHYISYISPDSFTLWRNMYIQLYAILGGIGYGILGPLVGSAVMSFVPEWFRVVQSWGPLFVGVVLILVIVLLPKGLLGVITARPTMYLRRKFASSPLNIFKVSKV